jgi:hypothetical protein
MMKTGSRAFFCGQKSKYGYNMQAVCDADGRFLSVWINHPASTSDFMAFLRSKLYLNLTCPGFLSEGFVILSTKNICFDGLHGYSIQKCKSWTEG